MKTRIVFLKEDKITSTDPPLTHRTVQTGIRLSPPPMTTRALLFLTTLVVATATARPLTFNCDLNLDGHSCVANETQGTCRTDVGSFLRSDLYNESAYGLEIQYAYETSENDISLSGGFFYPSSQPRQWYEVSTFAYSVERRQAQSGTAFPMFTLLPDGRFSCDVTLVDQPSCSGICQPQQGACSIGAYTFSILSIGSLTTIRYQNDFLTVHTAWALTPRQWLGPGNYFWLAWNQHTGPISRTDQFSFSCYAQ